MRHYELSQVRPTKELGQVSPMSREEKLRHEVTLLLRLSFLVGIIIVTLGGIIIYCELTF